MCGNEQYLYVYKWSHSTDWTFEWDINMVDNTKVNWTSVDAKAAVTDIEKERDHTDWTYGSTTQFD